MDVTKVYTNQLFLYQFILDSKYPRLALLALTCKVIMEDFYNIQR